MASAAFWSNARRRGSKSPAAITPWAANSCTRSASIADFRLTMWSCAMTDSDGCCRPSIRSAHQFEHIAGLGAGAPSHRIWWSDRTISGYGVEIRRDIEAGRALLYRACASVKFPDPLLTAAAKVFCNEMGGPSHGRSRSMADTASPTSSPPHAFTAALATDRSAAAHPKPYVTSSASAR